MTDEALRMKSRQKVGQIGHEASLERDTSIRSLNPIEAGGLRRAPAPGDAIGQTFNVLRRLVTGKEGIEKLSGPLGILHLTGGVTEMTMAQKGYRPWAKSWATCSGCSFQLAAHAVRGYWDSSTCLPLPDPGRRGGCHDPGGGCDRKASYRRRFRTSD